MKEIKKLTPFFKLDGIQGFVKVTRPFLVAG
jgi:hypothetical protein